MRMNQNDSGNLFIISAPSGGGKTSLIKKLVDDLPNIKVSVSHTTRQKRPAEKHGIHYFFIDDAHFQQMINENAFVEHARVFNHYYGTSIAQINDQLYAGIDIVLDIDWQGAQQIKCIFPNAISIFIVPPSLEVLQQRLTNRQQDDEQTILNRMQRAHDELSHYAEFDYLIVNDNFNKAADELMTIVLSERLRMSRQKVVQQQLLSFLLETEQ